MSNENNVVLPEPAMNEEGYLPCPFCGSDHVSLSTGEKADGEPWYYIECESCTATAEPEKWNERALLATATGLPAQAVRQITRTEFPNSPATRALTAFCEAMRDNGIQGDDMRAAMLWFLGLEEVAPQAQKGKA